MIMRERIKKSSEFEYAENEHVKGDSLNYQELIWLQMNRVNLTSLAIDSRDYSTIIRFRSSLRTLSSVIRAATKHNDRYQNNVNMIMTELQTYDDKMYLRRPDMRQIYIDKLFEWYDTMVDALHFKGMLLESDITVRAGFLRRNSWKKA